MPRISTHDIELIQYVQGGAEGQPPLALGKTSPAEWEIIRVILAAGCDAFGNAGFLMQRENSQLLVLPCSNSRQWTFRQLRRRAPDAALGLGVVFADFS